MINRRYFAGLLVGGTAISALQPSFAAGYVTSSRKDEVSSLRAFAEMTHPRGWEAKSNIEWRRRWEQLKLSAESLSDGAYFVETRRALGWFEDGHTTVLPFEFTGGVPDVLKQGPFGLTLPLRARVFDDGAFIVSTANGAASIAGKRIDRIGALSADALIREVARDWPGSTAWAHRWAGFPFSRPALLQALGACSDPNVPISIDLADRRKVINQRISPVSNSGIEFQDMRRSTSRIERAATEAQSVNFVLPMPDAKTLYVKIDEMADVDRKSFESLTRDCIAAFADSEQERLVIDLRLNGGGNNFLAEPLRRIIASSRFNQSGKLYVLIGPRTFSAAQNFANRLERETFALFVGTPTGGRPNHFGDAASFVGSATGLTSIVSTIPWFDSYPLDKRHWIMPDLQVPELFADWQAGRDPALDLALSHKPDQLIDELNVDRIYYYNRKSQLVEWQPFWDKATP